MRTITAIRALSVAAAGGAIVALLATHSVAAQGSASRTDLAQGKALFEARGCYECHGTVGQGNRFSGPQIAPHPVAFTAYLKQLRTPRRVMPPYSAVILSDADAGKIYTYLQSIREGPPASHLPILAAVDTGNAGPVPKTRAADVAHGKAIFAENCATCHTSGGIGPALAGEKSRKSLQAAISFIKSPQPPMPALYPSKLSEQDVADVAAYVESL